MSKQQKFQRREIERNSWARCFVPSHVDFQISDAQLFRLSLRSTAQYRAYPGEQFRKRERFDQIIICAQFESFTRMRKLSRAGKKKNRLRNPPAPSSSNNFQSALVCNNHPTITK